MIFPMFEFEMHGDLNDMIKMEEELLEFLGFGDKNSFPGTIVFNPLGKERP